MINIRLPSITAATEKEQLMQIKSYLHQLVGDLNWALSSIESGNNTEVTNKNSTLKAVTKDELATSFNELKSLITKSSNAVPKAYAAPADIKMMNYPGTAGWYKIGKITGDMCAVVTVTIGGIFQCDQVSPSVVDIATHYHGARIITRLPSLVDNQLSKIGIIMESPVVYGVYVYYNSNQVNPVSINIHPSMGTFQAEEWTASDVSESDLLVMSYLRE